MVAEVQAATVVGESGVAHRIAAAEAERMALDPSEAAVRIAAAPAAEHKVLDSPGVVQAVRTVLALEQADTVPVVVQAVRTVLDSQEAVVHTAAAQAVVPEAHKTVQTGTADTVVAVDIALQRHPVLTGESLRLLLLSYATQRIILQKTCTYTGLHKQCLIYQGSVRSASSSL